MPNIHIVNAPHFIAVQSGPYKLNPVVRNSNPQRCKWQRMSALAMTCLLLSIGAVRAQIPVKITEEDQVIPTYLSGPPDPNPMFFFGKQSQGAEGRIYPYPLYDNLTNRKGEKSYHLVYLENEYIKVGILPEIGGRVFSALDKTNNYDFVYHQHVIKPALIGLIGSWISGGIEWNVPHHHRATTFSPVQWSKEEHADGSKTIWVGELEVRQRMRWAVGYTLRPGSSVLECSVRIINRTPLVNTMLCFANVAVHVNENYQVIFPPSTQWATGHSKRVFSSWPLASNHTDMSWYKNNINSASWFAVNDQDDFVAGYDHGLNAGTMTIANHHIIPGKKFFTWGVGNMWDKILTDNDGPYLEIMVGAYSDNQPDYSWLQPFEERSFKINWYPFRGIDGVKNSNLDAAVNLEVKDGKASFGFYTTKAYKTATVSLKAGNKIISQHVIAINPGKPYSAQATVPTGTDERDLRAAITVSGRELVAYSPIKLVPTSKPIPTTIAAKPADYKNDEELFLAGQRIDQFHNPSLDADPYWEEALRRDPGNVNANTGMGLLNLQRAKFEIAERYFRKAIERLTAQYTTPKNAESLYYLGVTLKAQGRLDEAFSVFYKATWSQEWKSPAFFALAEIASTKGNFTEALDLANQALDANALHLRAYGLKAAVLRHLGRNAEAVRLLTFARAKTDPLDARLMAEHWMAAKDPREGKTLAGTLNDNPADAQETAAEYMNAGLWTDGMTVLSEAVAQAKNKTTIPPLVYYYLGYFAEKLGDQHQSAEYRLQAARQSPEYVFPFQYEAITVLRSAIQANAKDAHALYYLGNLLYDWQPEASTALWERSAAIDPNFAITWRNLAIAYVHQGGDSARVKAITAMERAVALSSGYPTHFAELDKLYQGAAAPVAKRLAILEQHQSTVVRNDEALGSLINLKTFSGKTGEAIRLLQSRTFSIWENSTGFNSGQAWADAHLVQGLQYYHAKQYQLAIADFTAALNPPANLRAEQRFDLHSAQLNYWTGCAYAELGLSEKAKAIWNTMSTANDDDIRRERDSDLESGEQRYFQTLAKKRLDSNSDSEGAFNVLVSLGNIILGEVNAGGASEGSGKHLALRSNKATAYYIIGLGYKGLENKVKALEAFETALTVQPDFLAAKLAIN